VTTRERHAKHVTVAVYLGLPKESGGLFQYARTVLHSLARRSDHAERLVALSRRGTEWGAACASIGVEWHEVDDLTLDQCVAGRLLRGRVARHRWARAAMPRVTSLGRALDCLGADICIYGNSEHFAHELATPSLIPPLEAFQLGCPVATSHVYGVPEQLGEAALLFDPSSVAEIQEAVERLWSDDELCHALVRLGNERARAWGPEQFSRRLWSVFDTVVASSR